MCPHACPLTQCVLVDHHYPASDHDGSSCRPLTGSSIEGPVVGGVVLVVGVALVTAVEGVSVDAWLLGLAVMADSVKNKQNEFTGSSYSQYISTAGIF